MNEREIIRAITPRLIIAQLETVQCFVTDLAGTTRDGELPLEYTTALKEAHVRLIELTGQMSQLVQAAQIGAFAEESDQVASEPSCSN